MVVAHWPNVIHANRPESIVAGDHRANATRSLHLLIRAAKITGRAAALIARTRAPRRITACLLCAVELIDHGSLHGVARHHHVAERVEGLWEVLDLDEDPRQQQLRHHQARSDGEPHAHAGHRGGHHEADPRPAVGHHSHDHVEKQDAFGALAVQADEGVADGQHQKWETALQDGVDAHLGEIKGSRMIQLVLGLAQEHRPLCGKGIHHPQDCKQELGKDQHEAGEQPWLDAGQVPLQLHKDPANEHGGQDGLDGAHQRQGLVASGVHQLPVEQSPQLPAEPRPLPLDRAAFAALAVTCGRVGIGRRLRLGPGEAPQVLQPQLVGLALLRVGGPLQSVQQQLRQRHALRAEEPEALQGAAQIAHRPVVRGHPRLQQQDLIESSEDVLRGLVDGGDHRAALLRDLLHVLDQGIRHLGVQAAGRLIQEQQGGASNQRERNVGTLPLATGDASDQAWGADHGVGTLPQVQLVDDIFNHLAALILGKLGQDEGRCKRQVLARGQGLVHDVILGDVSHAASHLGKGMAIIEDVAFGDS
mmetsp:Transcript_23882/g.56584  ORF Transcript_23882/g.56584 Transcript_23882/m.56584 type:complete len:533 (+) Transcript_23882:367-1965(+)